MCYLHRAVTGLPNPQDNHALIMTRFAGSLIVKMNQLVNSEEILRTLGEDTAALEMRVGMHRYDKRCFGSNRIRASEWVPENLALTLFLSSFWF